MILFFDTESTGLIDRRSGPQSPTQPHLVQLGALLTDQSGRQTAEPLCVIIRPEGWTIPSDAAAVHGITTEIATEKGISLAEALDRFDALAAQASTVVAHNFAYDSVVMQAAYFRADRAHPFAGKDFYCTMKQATNVCRLPGNYGFKWPSLTEAHIHFFGESFTEAHNALADVQACMRIYFALRGCKGGR